MRAAANAVGIYGNNPEEAYNFSAAKDSTGDTLGASMHDHVIHFKTPPPVYAIWLVTMYKQPEMQLVANPIKRYSVGDHTSGPGHLLARTGNSRRTVATFGDREGPTVDGVDMDCIPEGAACRVKQ